MTDPSAGNKKHHPTKSYVVGYCKPPKHTQFKKGTSGNPSGGKKQPFGFKADEWTNPFVDFFLEPVEMTANGKKLKMSRYEHSMRQLIFEALNGNADSSMELLEESDFLQVLIDDEYHEPSAADLACIEQVERDAAAYQLEPPEQGRPHEN